MALVARITVPILVSVSSLMVVVVPEDAGKNELIFPTKLDILEL